MIHHVFANRSNVGDWLTARAIQRLLPSPVTEHLCDAPFVGRTLARLEECGPGDIVLVGGGGLVMDYFADFWTGLLRRLPASVPLVLWGVGACAPKRVASDLSPAIVRAIVRRASLIAARDPLTRSLLPEDAPVRLVGCPSLTGDRLAPPASPGTVLHAVHKHTLGEDVAGRVSDVARRFANETGRRYVETDHRIPQDDEKALARASAALAESEVVVSSRLHGCLLAFAAGRRLVAVSGDRKLDSTMRWAGLESWLIDATDPYDLNSLGARLRLLDAAGLPPQRERFVAAARRDNQAFAVELLAFQELAMQTGP